MENPRSDILNALKDNARLNIIIRRNIGLMERPIHLCYETSPWFRFHIGVLDILLSRSSDYLGYLSLFLGTFFTLYKLDEHITFSWRLVLFPYLVPILIFIFILIHFGFDSMALPSYGKAGECQRNMEISHCTSKEVSRNDLFCCLKHSPIIYIPNGKSK